MKIYFAGAFGYHFHEHMRLNVLESYFYLSGTTKKNIAAEISKCDTFFLDSGAFSAFTQQAEINIDEYIQFCLDNNITNYAVLDKIGDAEGTLANQKYMENKGAKPIPCFHYGEEWKYLDLYCKNYDYVALGGMVPITTAKLKNWLDVVFTKYPNHKFHGFGLTVLSLMSRYPWYSVDSTTYLQGTKTASIYVNGKIFTFNGDANDEFNKFNHEDKKSFKYMCDKYGFTREKLIRTTDEELPQTEKGYWLRCLYNIYFFIEYLSNRKAVSFKIKQYQLNNYVEVETNNLSSETIKQDHLAYLRKEFPNIKESSLELIHQQRIA